jgi:hypothetical protein
MWGRFGQKRNIKRRGAADPFSIALEKVGGLFRRQQTKRTRTSYGRPVGLGVGALIVVATLSLVFVLRRRAARQGAPSEGTNEEANEEA